MFVFLDLVIFLELLVDASVVEDAFVVDKGIEEGAFLFVSKEEERAEDERLNRFFDSEEQGRVGAVRRIIAGVEIDRDESGKEDVGQTDGGEDVDLLEFDEVPNAVDEGDGEREPHRNIRAEVIETFAVFAAFAQNEDGSEDVDKNVSQGAVLLLGGGFSGFFGHVKTIEGDSQRARRERALVGKVSRNSYEE